MVQGDGKENFLRNRKKRKLKPPKLSKINILGEQEPSVQSADRTKAKQVWSWGNVLTVFMYFFLAFIWA